MDRASLAVTDPAAAMEAVIAEAVGRRNSPEGLWDRLHGLEASFVARIQWDRQELAQSHRYVGGEYRKSVQRRYAAHRIAAKCVRRRIKKLVKRGVL